MSSRGHKRAVRLQRAWHSVLGRSGDRVQPAKAAAAPDKVNPSLDKVARLLNLLGRDNIRPAPDDIVAIVHGAATPIVANSVVYAAKLNPNLDLIENLREARITVAVCSQALYANGISTRHWPQRFASMVPR